MKLSVFKTVCFPFLAIATTYALAETESDRIEALETQLESLSARLGEQTESRTHIGGYGELHYNNLQEVDGDQSNKMDFHRFVLFFSHRFSDSIRFVSELELEHSLAGEGKPGEVELEQAYIELDHNSQASTQAGLFLVPVGFLNETHEPPVFYGVERNEVESIILPTTWWEAGVQHIRRFGDGWQWNIAVHSGLKMPTSDFRIRSGRQKVAEADATHLAYTTRLKYAIPGLEWAATYQLQKDPSQIGGDGLDDGSLLETHIAVNRGKFGLKALYAAWDFGGYAVETAGGNPDSQEGRYLEASYKPAESLGLFARISDVDAARSSDNFKQNEIGFNWWPVEDVVIKFDWRKREHDISTVANTSDFDGFDLGVGYHF